ncbi:MAG: leucyl-tRNA synthetase, partial [Candidatus Nanohaloarchaea archaeon]
LSRLQHIIENTTEGLEDFQTRKAGLNAFFELNSLINRYRKRSEILNEDVVNHLTSTQVRLMAPFTPHICEELWSKLGNDRFVSQAEWPEANETLIDEEVENRQEFVDSTVKDIRELEKIVDDFNTVKIVLADDWKREVFDELHDIVEERPEFGEAMGRMVEDRKQKSDQIKSFLQDYLNNPGDLPQIFDEKTEKQIIQENKDYLENEFDTTVEIVRESDSDSDKADRAEPGKPAIILE